MDGITLGMVYENVDGVLNSVLPMLVIGTDVQVTDGED